MRWSPKARGDTSRFEMSTLVYWEGTSHLYFDNKKFIAALSVIPTVRILASLTSLKSAFNLANYSFKALMVEFGVR